MVGNRVWQRGVLLGPSPTAPEKFTVMPFSYDNAFGGIDKTREEKSKHGGYSCRTISGVGYHDHPLRRFIDGKPLPNTEETGRPITDSRGNYRPMSFGPIFRAWQPRLKYAGTYDDKWLENTFPFLPADFDERVLSGRAGGPADRLLARWRRGRTCEPHPRRPHAVQPSASSRAGRVLASGWRAGNEGRHHRQFAAGARPRAFHALLADFAAASKEYVRSAHRGRGANAAGLVPCKGIGEDVLSRFARTGCKSRLIESLESEEKKQLKPLAVLATGMVTAVGLDAPSSCAAMRAAIDGFGETRFIDRLGEWIIGAAVPMDPPVRGRDKQARMAASAIAECLPALGGIEPREVPLLLCVAEETRPGRITGLDRDLLAAISTKLGTQFASSSAVIANGRVGGVEAVLRARQLIDEGYPYCLVAGVDSFLVAGTLAEAERKRRLLTSENSDGFIPGEAAAAVLLGPGKEQSERAMLCLGTGLGMEKATVDSEQPLRPTAWRKLFVPRSPIPAAASRSWTTEFATPTASSTALRKRRSRSLARCGS